LDNNYTLKLHVEGPSGFIESIYKSLYPDTKTPPPDCNVHIESSNNELYLELTCKRVGLLRALFNSYFSILSMLIHVYEGFTNESTKNSSRGPETTI
jgi:tRNA threonylcarbamoyladenosine modification (KEOPS) complex  Pcc1 subunit